VPSERVERKLAAIVAADVAGYSRLMGVDEEGTLARLKAHRRELIDPKIAEHHGRIVKTTGDGLLIEFASVVDAVGCAVELQQRMSARNAGVPTDKRIELRVGINLGDIIIDGDDLYGDGVNIAARLEGLAEPGGICISRTVLDHARGKVSFDIEDWGTRALKNIAQPVHVYCVRFDGSRGTTFQPSRPTLQLPDKPSIAVLPFQNMSGDPEQEFFADGMAEDIITALSKLRWFFVIARNSTFVYKGKSPDIRQVARELGVQYVLEGSVRKASNHLRITTQLVDAITANHIWAERYDREVADVFTVQDEITESVVAAIEPQLYAAEHLRIQSKPPESLDAWGCVIRALWHLGRIAKDDNEHARQLLHRAILLAPRYAKAYSLLAVAELSAVVRGSSDTDTAMLVAEQHVHAALTLDDNDPWSHFSLGQLETLRSQQEEAIGAYRRAIELNPNFALAHGCMGGSLAYAGKSGAALEAIERAQRMSPYDPFGPVFSHFAATAHFAIEDYAKGADCERRALRQRPALLPSRRMLAACLVGLGQVDDARPIISELLKLDPRNSIRRDAYGYAVFARLADQERYVAALRKAGLPE
jgi:adenylate cyclase